jgi:hypothetical protein
MVATLSVAFAACNQKEPPAEQAAVKKDPEPNPFDRELNNTELDSLKQMKVSQAVTRDEYWDGYGGVLGNENFEVWYPNGKVNVLQGMAMLKLCMGARTRTRTVFGAVPNEKLVVICTADLDAYGKATGREWWHYSRMNGDTITVQPPILLHTRGLLPVVGPREYFEWAIGKLSHGNAPRWVQEGFASYLSGEAAILEDQRKDYAELPLVIPTKEMESALKKETDRKTTRRAYYNAYRLAEEIARTRGEDAMARFIVALAEDDDVDQASREAFGTDFDDVVEAAGAWTRAQ